MLLGLFLKLEAGPTQWWNRASAALSFPFSFLLTFCREVSAILVNTFIRASDCCFGRLGFSSVAYHCTASASFGLNGPHRLSTVSANELRLFYE